MLRKHANRIWVRLTLAFTAVVVIGVIVNTAVGLYLSIQEANRAAGQDILELEFGYQFTQPNGVLEALAAYYEENGSWENIDNVMAIVQSFTPPNAVDSRTFSFMDDEGNVLYDSHPENLDAWANIVGDRTFPVVVEGEEQGYVRFLAASQIPDLVYTETQDEFIQAWLEDWVETRMPPMAVIGIITGLAFGTLFSRTLTAPLRGLAEAAQAIGSRDLSRRVDVRGSTEVRQLAASFNTMAADLEQAEKLRRNLVADVAHELRTPLTVLQGNLRAILDGVYPLTKEEVAGLYDQTRLLSRLVKDLHEIAQAEAKKLPLQREMLDLNMVVGHGIATFENVAEMEGVHLTVEKRDKLLVEGDYTRLSQVLNNLLSNALRHTPTGGQITIATYQEGNRAVLSVSDTGSGIAAEHLPHVFERFYRVDRSRSRHRGGTGLGLAISRAIVEAHEGEIEVTSQQGQGTTFTVKLPLFLYIRAETPNNYNIVTSQ